ncbi:transposon Tf2-9 polyprotein [Trichonephila clavipes]|nr:transposon Tf2-9 polyprotein [Trichonephila clavipes]
MELVEFRSSVAWKTKFEDLISEVDVQRCESRADNIDYIKQRYCTSAGFVQKATVPITVGGRTFQIDLIFLPHAKGNRTLLGVDFLRTSGIVMDMRNNFWYFGDKPSFRIPFSKDVPLPVDDSPVEINSSSWRPTF